jgi:hypothetical protein
MTARQLFPDAMQAAPFGLRPNQWLIQVSEVLATNKTLGNM